MSFNLPFRAKRIQEASYGILMKTTVQKRTFRWGQHTDSVSLSSRLDSSDEDIFSSTDCLDGSVSLTSDQKGPFCDSYRQSGSASYRQHLEWHSVAEGKSNNAAIDRKEFILHIDGHMCLQHLTTQFALNSNC